MVDLVDVDPAEAVSIKHDADTWSIRGFSENSPTLETIYFPALASTHNQAFGNDDKKMLGRKQNKASKAPRSRAISICIPCFNEQDADLKRTIKSFHKQVLPAGYKLEIVIIMDGVDKMSCSMCEYIQSLFGINLQNNAIAEEEEGNALNPFNLFPQAETIIIEPTVETSNPQESTTKSEEHTSSQVGLTCILKRNNQRKINSHLWWLGGHARDINCEFTFGTDCGIFFGRMTLALLLARMNSDNKLAAVTGFQHVMSAQTQGDGYWELFTDPMGHMLRQIQRYEMLVSLSQKKNLLVCLFVRACRRRISHKLYPCKTHEI